MSRAVIYVRQSLDATGEAAGVARQREACEQLARARGWTIVQVCTDNSVSAYSGRTRPGWETVLDLAASGGVDVIVAWHVDRLTRSLRDLEHLIALAERTGVRVVTVGGDLDLTTDSGRLVARILASVARAEGERKAARQRLANEQAAMAGRAPSGPNPLGYVRVDGRYEVEPIGAAAVREGAQAVLAGVPLASVAEAWNEAGLRTAQGGNRWRGDAVGVVLAHPRYLGHRTHRGVVTAEDAWPAILTPETHGALTTMLSDPARTSGQPKGRRPRTLLTGLAACSVCGRTVTGARAANGRLMYRCRDYHLNLPREDVDAHVAGMVLQRLGSPDATALLTRDDESPVAGLRDEAAALRRRMDVLARTFADGTISEQQLRAGTGRLRARLDQVDAQLAEAGRVDVLAGVVGAEDREAMWEGLHLDRRRAVVQALCEVMLKPAGRGVKSWRSETVSITWHP